MWSWCVGASKHEQIAQSSWVLKLSCWNSTAILALHNIDFYRASVNRVLFKRLQASAHKLQRRDFPGERSDTVDSSWERRWSPWEGRTALEIPFLWRDSFVGCRVWYWSGIWTLGCRAACIDSSADNPSWKQISLALHQFVIAVWHRVILQSSWILIQRLSLWKVQLLDTQQLLLGVIALMFPWACFVIARRYTCHQNTIATAQNQVVYCWCNGRLPLNAPMVWCYIVSELTRGIKV